MVPSVCRESGIPVAARYAEEYLCLPMFPELTEDEVRRVVAAIRDFFDGSACGRCMEQCVRRNDPESRLDRARYRSPGADSWVVEEPRTWRIWEDVRGGAVNGAAST